MAKEHAYQSTIRWTGNKGAGTKDYKSYERSYTISFEQKQDIQASADPAFLGDPAKHNPEDLLMSSLSGCHMLWYLHLCAVNGICVTAYTDHAVGTMKVTAEGGGHFSEVTLQPVVSITEEGHLEKALQLHKEANRLCFIANSCNFPVYHKPTCIVAGEEVK